ncbi:hypothetical protein KIL84_007731 [Mauremys mutica]|uniref:Selenoprotein H n=1 Tax=Mauremys mutica TaxID=74926 RepID=A0A9D3X3N9_9SAUR|nr:hypothetical protein KIL84_007731 [Mauremys mutica]
MAVPIRCQRGHGLRDVRARDHVWLLSIVYGRNADAVSQALRRTVANVVVEINPETPRRNSFEVSLVKEDGSTVELWSGIKKGPPRKLKFPEPQKVADVLKSSLV